MTSLKPCARDANFIRKLHLGKESMMRDGRFKALACTISRGGFSDERFFSINEGKRYSGVAARKYFWTAGEEPLADGEPPLGQTISGVIAAYLIETRRDGVALVSVPDGEVIAVPISALLERPCKAEAHVPVGS